MRLRTAVALGGLGALLAIVPGSLGADQQITASPNGTSFSPSEVTVNVGDTVTVSKAAGSLQHNVHYDDELTNCPGSPTTSAWTCPRNFTATGNHTFHCDLHTSMTGTVHVVEPGSTTTPTTTTPTTTTPTTTTPTTTTPTQTPTPTLETVPLKQLARVPKGCAPRRTFRIRLRHPDRLSAARIFVNKKRVASPKGEKLSSRIKVRGLPKGRFTLKVEVTRKDGSRLVGKRRLRTCK
jgi:plastocyanin